MAKENPTRDFKFEVEYISGGQRRPYGPSEYHYKVTSNDGDEVVRKFCMEVLKKSYLSHQMPDPFVGSLELFIKRTDNNKDTPAGQTRVAETYEYKVRMECCE